MEHGHRCGRTSIPSCHRKLGGVWAYTAYCESLVDISPPTDFIREQAIYPTLIIVIVALKKSALEPLPISNSSTTEGSHEVAHPVTDNSIVFANVTLNTLSSDVPSVVGDGEEETIIEGHTARLSERTAKIMPTHSIAE